MIISTAIWWGADPKAHSRSSFVSVVLQRQLLHFLFICAQWNFDLGSHIVTVSVGYFCVSHCQNSVLKTTIVYYNSSRVLSLGFDSSQMCSLISTGRRAIGCFKRTSAGAIGTTVFHTVCPPSSFWAQKTTLSRCISWQWQEQEWANRILWGSFPCLLMTQFLTRHWPKQVTWLSPGLRNYTSHHSLKDTTKYVVKDRKRRK